MAKFSRKAELFIERALNKYSPNIEWDYFVNPYDDAQYVIYDGVRTSFPDYKGSKNGALLLLVEVKSSWGYFDNVEGKLAIKLRQLKSYARVSRKEGVPVRIVFVVKYGKKVLVFWEELDNLRTMQHSIEKCVWKYKTDTGFVTEEVDTLIFDSSFFRTDLENIGNLK